MKKLMIRLKRYNTRRTWILVVGIFLISLYLWTTPNYDKEGTIKIWDRNRVLLYESSSSYGRREVIAYDQIPHYVIDAAVAVEDETFWTNPGIDFSAIMRSLWINLSNQEILTGASTITQQLARTSMSTSQIQYNQSYIRKLREMLMALRINLTMGKHEIMERYLNSMYFGNMSYGIQSASRMYFGKDAGQLSLAESALLVGLISSPEARNPYTSWEQAKKRQSQVLLLMQERGYITSDQRTRAGVEELSLQTRAIPMKAAHFVQYIFDELQKNEVNRHNGLNIYTTLDYTLQSTAQEVASRWVERLSVQHDLSNAALVMLDNTTREIRVMLGGVDYFDASSSGQVNSAVALRQPGSTLKPITYAAAFAKGETPASLIYDVKKVYLTKKGEGYTPNNFDGTYNGMVLAREALASSLNLPAVEMLHRIGLEDFISTSRNLGITTFTDLDRYDLSITLGGGEVTLLDLTNVYASFARGGKYNRPFAIARITDDNGRELYTYDVREERAVWGEKSEGIAYLITDILSDAKARMLGFGEKNPLVLSRPAAVKTGTTTDWHDNWTVGYTPEYSVGVWVGNNDNRPMRDITGIVGAAPIWNEFLETVLKGMPVKVFSVPDKIVRREICAETGMLVDGICQRKKFEIFLSDTVLTRTSSFHRAVLIDSRNGLLATDSCGDEYTVRRIFLDYPPEVYGWAVENGKELIPQDYSPNCPGIHTAAATSRIEIISPRNKAMYETAPDMVVNEAIVFEVQASSDITSVSWLVNGKPAGVTRTQPFKLSWKPYAGIFSVTAIGETDARQVKSNTVQFTVHRYEGIR